MVEIYTNTGSGVATPVNTSITFNNIKYKIGCTNRNVTTPTNTVALTAPGVYNVSVNVVLANNTSATAITGIQLFNNGVADPSALANATLTASNAEVETLTINTLVRVRPNCPAVDNVANLQVRVMGVNATVYFANMVVTKVA